MVSEIYCYGGIDIYRDVFNAIAMLNGDKNFIQSLITIGVIVGGFWSMITLIGGDLIKPFTSWLIPMAVMQTVFLTPTSTVHLIDVVQAGRHETVDHVPYGLALIAGFCSRLSHAVTEKVEVFFSLPGELKYSKTGGIFAANLLANQKIMAIQDEDFAENMRSFMGQCVLYDVALGIKYSIKDLRNTNNIWGLISRNASPARAFIWKEGRGRGDIITCQEGVEKFNRLWGSTIDQTACAAGARLYHHKDDSKTAADARAGGVSGGASSVSVSSQSSSEGQCRYPLSKQEFLRFLPIHYGVLTSMGGSATEVLKQQMMISALVDGQDHASMLAGNASNFAARKAYLQQRSSYETLGKLAADTLPIMRAVLELLCYSLFLFIMPILVLPMGYRVLVNWVQTIVWLAMWPPLYAILHLIMVSAIAMKTKAFMGISNPNGITLASSLGIQNISADMATMAGYLSMSIPFICIAIVKGLSSFVHMSSSLGAVSQGAATSAAQEAFTGTYSLGNTSMDNHSFGSVNMLNQNYDSSLSSGNTKIQEGHTSITTSADGSRTASIEQSHLPISMDFASNTVNSKRMAASQELSTGQSQMQSMERSLGSSVDTVGNLGKTLSNSTNIQEGWTEQQQQEAGKTFQKLNTAVNRFAQNHDISTGKAAQVLAQAGISVLGNGLTTNMNSSNEDRELVGKAKEFAQLLQLDKTGRIAEQATQHLSKHSSDDQVQSYLRSQQASLTEAARDSESAQKHFESSQRLNKEADKIESQSATFNRNHNDRFVKWLADQPATHGLSGKIGYREAIGMINHKSEETAVYAERYKRENMQEMSLDRAESSLKEDFKKVQLSSSVDRGVADRLDQHAATQIDHALTQQAEGIEKRIGGKIQETSNTYDAAKEKVNKQSSAVEDRYQQEKDKVGIAEAVGQSMVAIRGGIIKAAEATDEALRYLEDHPETLLTLNSPLINRPDTLPLEGVKNNEGYSDSALNSSMSESSQKIVKVKQAVKIPRLSPLILSSPLKTLNY